MRAITLSGWGQPSDVLQVISPGSCSVNYARHDSVQAALLELKAHSDEGEMIIGWSLGGQLAVRAIASGLLKPKKLVLIATPFQFVARPEWKLGMPADLFNTFRDNYADNPARTLTKAWATIVKGDTNGAEIRRHLEGQDKAAMLTKNWLGWLNILEQFSCSDLYLANFPPTLLIHGREDAVVYSEQSLAFQKAIPHAELVTLEGCGHAPHWHDTIKIQMLIRDFADV